MSQIEVQGDIIDVEECVRRGERPRPGARYRIKVGNPDLKYGSFVIADPVPTGRQVLEAAGQLATADHILLAVLTDGMLEEVRLDETVDIFPRGVERFIAFKSDRTFRFILDDRRFEWGAADILGRVLLALSGMDPAAHGVWLEQRGEPDLFIKDEYRVPLDGEEVEHFRTGPVFILCIESTSHRWPKNTITTEEIAALGGWDPSVGVIEVDKDQNERQLKPGETVTLKPGTTYGKKLCWKRG
jgi:hypothetical protein